MTLAAEALESGDQVDFKGRSLVDALHFNIRNAMGDSKAAIRSAIDVLSSKPQKSTLRCSLADTISQEAFYKWVKQKRFMC